MTLWFMEYSREIQNVSGFFGSFSYSMPRTILITSIASVVEMKNRHELLGGLINKDVKQLNNTPNLEKNSNSVM